MVIPGLIRVHLLESRVAREIAHFLPAPLSGDIGEHIEPYIIGNVEPYLMAHTLPFKGLEADKEENKMRGPANEIVFHPVAP